MSINLYLSFSLFFACFLHFLKTLDSFRDHDRSPSNLIFFKKTFKWISSSCPQYRKQHALLRTFPAYIETSWTFAKVVYNSTCRRYEKR